MLATLRRAFDDENIRALVTGYIEREIFAEAEQLLLELKARQNRPTKASAHEAVIGISTVLLGALVSRYLLRAGPHAAMQAREFEVLLERLLRGTVG